MGEYIKYKGKSIKIGTCEDLYYTDYGRYTDAVAKGLVTQDEYNARPDIYGLPETGCRFRFPFPDEDSQPLGEVGHDNFDRGLLISIDRGESFANEEFPLLNQKYDVRSRTQPELIRKMVQVNPNNVMKSVDIELVQQRPMRIDGEIYLLLVYRCPYSGERWRIEDKADVLHIAAQITQKYIEATTDTEEQKFWQQVNERILQGYEPIKKDI